MGKYEKLHIHEEEYFADKEDYIRNDPSTRINLKFPEPSFPIAIDVQRLHAERLVSCWNACIQLEHPEEDIKKLIEALKDAGNIMDYLLGAWKECHQAKEVKEALALIKE